MEPLESLLGLAKVSIRRVKFAVAGDGQVRYSKVNAGHPASCRQSLRFYLAGEAREPHPGPTPDGESLYLSLDRSVQPDTDSANLGKTQPVSLQVEAGLRVGEAVIAPGKPELWIAGFPTRPDSAKECLKGFVEPSGNILQHLGVHIL